MPAVRLPLSNAAGIRSFLCGDCDVAIISIKKSRFMRLFFMGKNHTLLQALPGAYLTATFCMCRQLEINPQPSGTNLFFDNLPDL